ncbi:zinc finger protein [Cannes 8 virus]|nr:zinc finger protein [Cannes 8 virus]
MDDIRCEICGVSFASVPNFKKHLKSKRHQRVEKGETDPEKFFCGACRYETTIKCNYLSHLLSAKHERNFKKENSTPEGHCECCDIDVGCHSKLRRHQQTREHRLTFEKFCRISPKKLEKLKKEIFDNLILGEKGPFSETAGQGNSRNLSPVGICIDPKQPDVLFSWLKKSMSVFSELFGEKEGKCYISWINHRYLLSKGDFLSLVVFLSVGLYRRRIKLTMEEVGKRNDVRRDSAVFCLPEIIHKQFEEKITELQVTSIESGFDALRFCEGFWKWWNEEQHFNEKLRECRTGMDLIFKGKRPGTIKATTLGMASFLMTVANFTASHREKFDDEILVLAFLDAAISELRGDGGICETYFWLSFCKRSSKIRKNVFLSAFGIERLSKDSERASSMILNRWSFEKM